MHGNIDKMLHRIQGIYLCRYIGPIAAAVAAAMVSVNETVTEHEITAF